MPGKTALEHHLSKRSSFHWSMGAAPSRALWCSLEFGGAVPFSTRRQPLVYQLKAEGTRSFRECRFCFVNEGSNCRIRLKPMLSGADDRSRHKAILYSINQVFIIYTPAGRGDGGGGALVDSTEVMITALYFHTMIYIFMLSHPLSPATAL